MKKRLYILLFIALSFSILLQSMQGPKESQSRWGNIPYELQHYVLSYVALDKIQSVQELINKVKSLANQPLFKDQILDPVFISNLIKKYIELKPDSARDEFFNAVRANNAEITDAFLQSGIKSILKIMIKIHH